MLRHKTREVRIGNVVIGGEHPIAVQSMTNTRTEDVEATVAQILLLEAAGCEIVRCTVPTQEAADALREIKKQIHIPLVADIHFDYKMAIAAIENGADKIRINPGNIGSEERVRAVVEKAKEYNVPIRIGVNSGSLEKDLLEKYGGVTAEGIVESALDKVHMIERMGYENLVMKIQGNGTVVMKWPDEFDGEEIAVSMNYDLDKEAKIFILHRDDEAIKEVVKKAKGAVTTDRLNTAISSLEGSYDYNIEQNQLTLTEREYGEQMVFEKR